MRSQHLPPNRRAFAGLCLLLGLALLAATGFASERRRVTILCTTDLHGHVAPEDDFTGKPAQQGLAKIATLVAEARADAPHALLVDCGDTIQGSPMEYVHARVHPEPVDPTILVMNALRYDAMTVGNHEYNFGLTVLRKARSESSFPWLSANTVDEAAGKPAYEPILLKVVDGVRVAVVGITTPGIPNWEDPPNYAGLRFDDPVEAARHWVAEARSRLHADVVVLCVHMGLEEDLARGDTPPPAIPRENTSLEIARTVPGIDLILMGHTHREVPALVVNGVLMAQAGRWGDHLIRADLYVEKAPSGSWSVIGKASRSLPVTASVPADPAILKLAQPYLEETQAWLRRPIGRCASELLATESRERDTALIDLIHRVQLEAGDADVSLAASFNPKARIPSGDVTVRDIYGLYPYENTLVVVEATGLQLRQALEQAARFYRPYSPGRTPAELADPRIPGYNFDTASGVTYAIDLTRPPGQRVVDLRFRGKPLADGQKLRLALNNYRFSGGGGYTMFKGCPVLHKSSEEIRNLIIDWIVKHHEIPATPEGNWTLLCPRS